MKVSNTYIYGLFEPIDGAMCKIRALFMYYKYGILFGFILDHAYYLVRLREYHYQSRAKHETSASARVTREESARKPALSRLHPRELSRVELVVPSRHFRASNFNPRGGSSSDRFVILHYQKSIAPLFRPESKKLTDMGPGYCLCADDETRSSIASLKGCECP